MSALAGLILVALPFVLSPGASFTLVLAHTLAGQRGAAARITTGTGAGIAVLATAVAISGLGAALQTHPVARTVLVLTGGAVLAAIAKALTLYAVVVPTLAGTLKGASLYLAFATIHIALMAAWLGAVAWAARHLPAARSPRVRAAIMVASGAALAAVALTTITSGLR